MDGADTQDERVLDGWTHHRWEGFNMSRVDLTGRIQEGMGIIGAVKHKGNPGTLSFLVYVLGLVKGSLAERTPV